MNRTIFTVDLSTSSHSRNEFNFSVAPLIAKQKEDFRLDLQMPDKQASKKNLTE
jgi:hypothetical protein